MFQYMYVIKPPPYMKATVLYENKTKSNVILKDTFSIYYFKRSIFTNYKNMFHVCVKDICSHFHAYHDC